MGAANADVYTKAQIYAGSIGQPAWPGDVAQASQQQASQQRPAGRIETAVAQLDQISQGLVDQARGLEAVLDRVLGGHPAPDAPIAINGGVISPGRDPGQRRCDVEALDYMVRMLGERLAWLQTLVERASEL